MKRCFSSAVMALFGLFLAAALAIAAEPKSAAEAMERGMSALADKDYDAAVDAFTEAIHLDPKNAKAFYNRGLAYDGKREFDKAIADLTEAIRLDPKDSGSYCSRGYVYGNKGDPDKAIADCTEAIRLDPNNATAFHNRGCSYTEKRDFDRAIADCTEAIRIDPKDITAFNNRADAYLRKGDVEKATADYKEVFRLNPNDARACGGRACLHWQKGELDEAIDDFTAAIRIDPENAAAHNNLGVIHWQKSEGRNGSPMPRTAEEKRALRKKAIAYWKQAVIIQPNFADALNNLGCAMRYREPGMDDAAYQKRLDKAVACFRESIRCRASQSDAHSNLALCHMELGHPDEAMAEFAAALKIRPDFPDAKVNIAKLFHKLGKDAEEKKDRGKAGEYYDRAVAHLEAVIRSDPRYVRAYAQLAEVRARQAGLAEGQARLERNQDAAAAMNSAAWLMATNVEDGLRNGKKAVDLATQAVQLIGPTPAFLDTAAAAWAETGDFAKAAETAKRAIDLAEKDAAKEAAKGNAGQAAKSKKLAEAIRQRLRLYEDHKPYRDAPLPLAQRSEPPRSGFPLPSLPFRRVPCSTLASACGAWRASIIANGVATQTCPRKRGTWHPRFLPSLLSAPPRETLSPHLPHPPAACYNDLLPNPTRSAR